jgi:hypothetical protein
MAAGGEQGAAAVLDARVPAKLAVPRSDAVVVVDLTVVKTSEKSLF